MLKHPTCIRDTCIYEWLSGRQGSVLVDVATLSYNDDCDKCFYFRSLKNKYKERYPIAPRR